MSKLTHAQRRKKHRAGTPRAKRRAALTSKMRLLSIGWGTRMMKAPSELALRIENNKLEAVDFDGYSLYRPRKHKGRVPGTIRPSRLPGGSGFRNNWEGAL